MFITGLCLSCFSIPPLIYFLRVVYLISEYPYSYRLASGFDEETLLAIITILALLAAAGIVIMIFGWMKQRNKRAMDSIENSSKQNYCDNCNLYVASKNSVCPICGKTLQSKGE